MNSRSETEIRKRGENGEREPEHGKLNVLEISSKFSYKFSFGCRLEFEQSCKTED